MAKTSFMGSGLKEEYAKSIADGMGAGGEQEAPRPALDQNGRVVTDNEMSILRQQYSKSLSQGMGSGQNVPGSLLERYAASGQDAATFGKTLSPEERAELSALAGAHVKELHRQGKVSELAEVQSDLAEAGLTAEAPQGTAAEFQMLGKDGLAQYGKDKDGNAVVVDAGGNLRKRSDLLREYGNTTNLNGDRITE